MPENFLRARSPHALMDLSELIDLSDLCPCDEEEEDHGKIPQDDLALAPGRSSAVVLREWLARQSVGRLQALRARAPRSIGDELARRRRSAFRPSPVSSSHPSLCRRSSRLVSGSY